MKHRIAIFLLITTILIFWLKQEPYWAYLIVFLIFIAVTSWGAFDIRLNYFLASFNYKKNCREKLVALTFDDGPTEWTPKFLEILDKYEAKATFFCIGKQAEKHPEILAKIKNGGHEIGGHSYTHQNSHGFLGTGKVIEEIKKTDEVFQLNHINTALYRPPFGVTNPNIAHVAKILNKKIIGWNVRSLDTVLKDEQRISARILRKIKPGSIVLMHDTSEKSLRALEILLLNLQKKQYRCCTIYELWNQQ